MFDFIKGKIIKKSKNTIVVDKFGFGILIEVPDSSKFNDKDFVYTYFVLKQEEIKIFGFKTVEERELFLKLIQIPQVGYKHAFSIISNYSKEEFEEIVNQSDVEKLTTLPGIGKKTANRIIVELKGKLDLDKNDEILKDLVSALINLGYDKEASIKAIKKAIKDSTNQNPEEILKLAIQMLTTSIL